MSSPEFADHGLIALKGEAFPAVIDGKLAPPSATHMLDNLVRHHILDDGLLQWPDDFELLTNDPGTTAMLPEPELPACDICRQQDRQPRNARYDGPASSRSNAPWAFLCSDCFALLAPPVLGMGRAQYLFTKAEIPIEVRDAFFRAREFWIARGSNPPPHHPFE